MFRCLCYLFRTKKQTEEDYTKIEYNDTIEFVAPITKGKVIKVYDGDTITVASRITPDLPTLYRFHIRLNGIDTPEIKGGSFHEKELAIKARDALADLIFDKTVYLKNNKTEKYGRVLSDVYLGDLHVNQWMLDNKYAVKYDGGTKKRPTEWN
uniref:TNase-like domain-containing protein n=1 Tax=viral metagenome TaxID=1070528 RepID=A0A6C0DRT6_9ZZZZ